MNTFIPLLRPHPCVDILKRDIYRVEAAVVDPDEIFYLHQDGVVKDSTLPWATTADYLTEDKAYLAINDYYVAHGQTTPFVRVEGIWRLCGVFNTGQTTQSIKL